MNISSSNSVEMKMGSTEHAKVQGGFNRDFMVQSERGVYRAQLAFSCFLQPEVGDVVLVNVDSKRNHIIAIIERPENQDAKLSFPANVTMETKHGNMSLTSHNNIQMTSSKEQRFLSEKLNITSNDTQIYSAEMKVSGKKLKAHWGTIQAFSDLITTAADRLVKTVKNSFSSVEGVEQKSSKNFVQNVSSTSTIRSQHAVITAEKDIKLDGERIHMG